jgi:hypothetical protein
VVLKVDNIGCYFAWDNKNVSKDPHASVLVRARVLISSYLSCYVHVQHLPRVLAWDAKLCDRLSRDRTTLHSDRQLLNSFGNYKCNSVLKDWLKNPTGDWSLCDRLLNVVKDMME